ncbi:chemotaxis protein CheA [Azohydromonas caseinilytica]|uniref:Chemotaxis protein CheA n=1 Tax=Azohydromonas caseinilytica TaxID=2728836 RepID=A0A848F8K3_9BURK|nr:chemotaxis protein CheA [Azohydromonas caseinilytica]NML14849.1 chemotaxis protein CheA [Azohydromonas caseinilytica]
MGETTSDNSLDAGIDLSQFYQVFFEEALENLERMEQMLLEVDITAADDEALNAIFRCAHSVKGGAATFGFNDVAELTHQMETLLDRLRRHELQPDNAMVDVLLQSGDALRAQLARHEAGGAGDPVDTTELRQRIRAMAEGRGAPAPAAAAPAPVAPPAPAPAPVVEAAPAEVVEAAPAVDAKPCPVRELELTVGPLQQPEQADNLAELFKEIPDLGLLEPLDGGHAADGMRRFKVLTTSSDDELLDLFTFHVARESMRLAPMHKGYGFHDDAPGAPPPEPHCEGYGFYDDAPGAPGAAAPVPAPATGTAVTPAAPAEITVPTPAAGPKPAAVPRVDKGESSTLRVSVEKVDQLINLVGELVITQAMLAQNSKQLDGALHQQLVAGLAALERNTRDLQESVMSIRMIPMSVVFSRFPRMLRDLESKLGKRIEMHTQGEATELDKGLVEKITDPLTHLVRNSADHGIELPAERKARGKAEHGSITLVASHQGGNIVIEVRDDGRGLDRDKLLRKARERGLDAPDTLSDAEVWGLIFAPGFSTAEVVTDVSGRGVGMDVVKKNITALGGTVEIDSAPGQGMSVKVRLPLTLAIMDGMSVGIGQECYIVPLASVVESFQVKPGMIRGLAGARVVEVRQEYMPVVDMQRMFDVPRPGMENPSDMMVVVEADGGRVALLVDELLGQQQVVVKNLEANYRRVDGISGATILGDGRVALILDVGGLVRRSRNRLMDGHA